MPTACPGPCPAGGQRFDSRPPCADFGSDLHGPDAGGCLRYPGSRPRRHGYRPGKPPALCPSSACDIAASCGTIANEILSRFGPSLGTKGRRYRRLHPLAHSGSFGSKTPPPFSFLSFRAGFPAGAIFLPAGLHNLAAGGNFQFLYKWPLLQLEQNVIYFIVEKEQN